MIKKKHISIIEDEAKKQIKQNKKVYKDTYRKTFLVRVQTIFRRFLKSEARRKHSTLSKVFDDILFLRYKNIKTRNEITQDERKLNKEIKRIKKKEEKLQKIKDSIRDSMFGR